MSIYHSLFYLCQRTDDVPVLENIPYHLLPSILLMRTCAVIQLTDSIDGSFLQATDVTTCKDHREIDSHAEKDPALVL